MQLPILRIYELDFYDSVRLFLKEDSSVFKFLKRLNTSHDTNGRIFIKGKFIKIIIESEVLQSDTPKSQKYYFVEESDVPKLRDPNLLVLSANSKLPDYVLEIDQGELVSIELLLDYTVK